MIDENESLLHRWVAAGDSGDVDAFDDLLHPDVVVHAPLGLSSNSIEQEKEVWRAARAAMPDIRHAIQEVVVSESAIAARAIVTGTMTGEFGGVVADGKPFRIDQAIWAHLRDGKADEIWEIVDTGDLLRQLGALQD